MLVPPLRNELPRFGFAFDLGVMDVGGREKLPRLLAGGAPNWDGVRMVRPLGTF